MRQFRFFAIFCLSLYLHIMIFAIIVLFRSTSNKKITSVNQTLSAYVIVEKAEEVKENKLISNKLISKRKVEFENQKKFETENKRKVKFGKKPIPNQVNKFYKNVFQSSHKTSTLMTKTIDAKEHLIQEDSEKEKKTLASLLHHAIAAKQVYPNASLMLNESGTIQIRFLLYPDGRIEQISLLKSSGFSNLDTSALSALKGITPFLAAKNFIHKETFFSVDVIFE